jgi:hypothetical protein
MGAVFSDCLSAGVRGRLNCTQLIILEILDMAKQRPSRAESNQREGPTYREDLFSPAVI